jgi:hypothetical protein
VAEIIKIGKLQPDDFVLVVDEYSTDQRTSPQRIRKLFKPHEIKVLYFAFLTNKEGMGWETDILHGDIDPYGYYSRRASPGLNWRKFTNTKTLLLGVEKRGNTLYTKKNPTPKWPLKKPATYLMTELRRKLHKIALEVLQTKHDVLEKSIL